ncbi:hypothetical protein PybrP1_007610 [[Pythium] brassicae (nom. inval.)]|nr:hypothetical protein PybrP1_007610 [[Pythium] brassicae (nom. inval.)]
MLAQLVADVCPSSASFFGFMGVASALVFASASRRGVRHGQVGRGHRVDGRDASGAGDAQHHPRGHGGCARHLRADRGGDHPGLDRPAEREFAQVRLVLWVRAPGGGSVLRAERSGGGHGDRRGGRRGRARRGPAGEALREHDPHPDFCRGAGALRLDRGADLVAEEERLSVGVS